jgi:3-oxoadipate enol-lactonase
MKVLIALAGAALLACAGFTTAFCQAPPPARQGRVTVPGARLYYEEAGRGPAVVLIHGGYLDRRLWDNEFRWLARDYRVVRYDVRAHGLSQTEAGSWSDYEDLRTLLDSLGIERAAIVGHSMGGRIAADLALAYPGRVSALVFMGPGLSGAPFGSDQIRAFAAEMRQALGGQALGPREFSRLIEVFAHWWCDGPSRAPSAVDPAVRAKVLEMLAGSEQRWRLGDGTELEPPAWGRLREIRAPTLAVVGALDVVDILEIVDAIAAQVPGARRVVIPGAAHAVNLEKPAEFEAAVRPFLAEHLRR